jgi:NADPH:quinone reductase-like Zn-dependent oxidoreductase/copper chaperone CopZ
LTDTITYTVAGMSSGHCRAAIAAEVGAVPGVRHVNVDLAARLVAITGNDLDDAALVAAIENAGYEAVRPPEPGAMRQTGSTMRAVVREAYGTVDVLRIAEVETPVAGDDEVLVRVHAAGVDQGVWHLMAGMPYAMRLAGFGFRAPKNPLLGYDVAGRVEAVGANAGAFQPGDEVFGTCRGSFAEFAVARADRLASKPGNVSFEEAAAVPTSGYTALQAVREHGRVRAGQRVLIIGAGGGVGTFAVQIAKADGAEVTGVSSTAKTELVRSLGADHVIDYAREGLADGRTRYDVILDIAGNRPLSELRHALTARGTLVIVGGEDAGNWLGVRRQLRAAALSPFVRQKLGFFIAKDRNEDLEELQKLLEAGVIRPVVDRTFPLDEVPAAIGYLRDGKARGKVVISI